ncbi:MAG TPA: class II glutamine amidotransferase [Solirubrobacteraceae bacterium]|nr:class II glutamine amidotransferase [Solirubrobacteraceae bacterium]
MCRLFGMSGGAEPVEATFWLLQAPDSLSQQSRREPDGTGLGWFTPDGWPHISKQALAAHDDRAFARQAQRLRSRTFVAHVRYATTGSLQPKNTHPFEQQGRLLAHNGMVEDLDRLEQELGPDRRLVHGDTDSERLFALITREIGDTGDVGAGIASAARWVAENLRMLAINLILIDAGDLWALRYPEVHPLFVLERPAGGTPSAGPDGAALDHARGGRIRATSAELAERPAVIVATEKMDDDPGWRPMASGELLHVDASLSCTYRQILDEPPAHPLSLAELEGHAAAAQRA